jgi:DNA-binding transcriptional ArsR family regulator
VKDSKPSGDELVRVLAALAHPQRLRILAALVSERKYVSQLARELDLSRPLVHLHLQRLAAAGLISGSMELSPDGKAMNWYSVSPFGYELSPRSVVDAVRTLTVTSLGKDAS